MAMETSFVLHGQIVPKNNFTKSEKVYIQKVRKIRKRKENVYI